ncbi:hypothetical protein [Acinetobacter baumannii]|uniref:hypothetical protein n=1 Tax=Acinetobacter baumannii TaxID=470 RepID=UPI0039A58AB3
MAYYLQLDGVDDYVEIPSMTFDEILINFIPENIIGNTSTKYYIASQMNTYRQTSGNDGRYQGYWLYSTWDGGSASGGGNNVVVQSNIRQDFKFEFRQNPRTDFTSANAVSTIVIGANTNKNNNSFLKAKVYSVTVMCDGSTVAHYDMSTQTVQDQSGNGYHATLVGGTWVDDGTGGGSEPVGTDGSLSLELKQSVYRDSLANLTTSQRIYTDGYSSLSLRQSIYEDIIKSLELVQNIYRDSTERLGINQAIFTDSTSSLSLIQQFYDENQTFISLGLQQVIYDDESVSLPFEQTIYKDDSVSMTTQQQMYLDGVIVLDLIQQFYEDTRTFVTLALRQEIYEDHSEALQLSQTIYNDARERLNTVQRIYSGGQIDLPLLISMRDDLNELIGTIDLFAKRVLNVDLFANRQLYVDLKGGLNMTAENQNFEMYQGDTKNIRFLIEDESLDLTGTTVKWVMTPFRKSEALLTKSTTDGISVVEGKVIVKLNASDSVGLLGMYEHEVEITDQLGNVSTVLRGKITIKEDKITS